MARGKRKTVKKEKPASAPAKPKMDLSFVPKPVDLGKLFIAPPSLPMRHDHEHSPVTEVAHPEVRLVIKTRYMEPKPHVLVIESAVFATIATVFAGLLLFMLNRSPALILPLLLPVWLFIVILGYMFFRE